MSALKTWLWRLEPMICITIGFLVGVMFMIALPQLRSNWVTVNDEPIIIKCSSK